MAKLTRTEKIIAALTAKGCEVVPDSRCRYIKLSRPGRSDFYFVGRNGALRAGKNASSSISLTDRINPQVFQN